MDSAGQDGVSFCGSANSFLRPATANDDDGVFRFALKPWFGPCMPFSEWSLSCDRLVWCPCRHDRPADSRELIGDRNGGDIAVLASQQTSREVQ